MDEAAEDSQSHTKWRQQLEKYFHLFEEAFDELHEAVVAAVKRPGAYVAPHPDYPSISHTGTGFPYFSNAGFHHDQSPRNFTGTVRPNTLFGLFNGFSDLKINFSKGEALKDFLKMSDFAKRLALKEDSRGWAIDQMVADAVESYLHRFGLDSKIEIARRERVIRPLIAGSVLKRLEMQLIVPIALTHFEADYFQLTDSTYIRRLPKKIQLARSRINSLGSGAQKMVVGAATHAFVSRGWYFEPTDASEARAALTEISQNVIDAVDQFFGALRIATGVSTGYAQVIWAPRKWALDKFCDLPTLYGATMRKYPSEFDNYAWSYQRPTVTRAELTEVCRLSQAIANSKSEAIAIAIRRLNTCLTRSDAADGLLDAIIGLEILLGDDENQSLSYKLRLRAGALALLDANTDRTATSVARLVKTVYNARSAIVHGSKRKISKKASATTDSRYEQEREEAAALLRFVLDVLLKHPQYLSPARIDEELLLRGAMLPAAGTEAS